MKRVWGASLIVGIGLALSACGSSAPLTLPASSAPVTPPATAVSGSMTPPATAVSGSMTPPATAVSEIPAVSSAAAATCATDLQTVNTALEAFFAVNQKYPATLPELATSGLLKKMPTFGGHSVTYDAATGTVTADC